MDRFEDVSLSVPIWDAVAGTRLDWEAGASVRARVAGGRAVIEGNAAGLRSLARVLLTLAGAGVADGTPVRLSDRVGLRRGSAELVLERREASAGGHPRAGV